MRYMVLLLLLAACASPEQIAQQEINECQSLGFQYKTPEFAQCRLQVRLQRQQMQHQAALSTFDRNQATLDSNFQNSMQSSPKCYDTNIGLRCW